MVMSASEMPPATVPRPPEPEAASPGRLEGLRHVLQYDAGLVTRLAREVVTDVPVAAAKAMLHPRQSARDVLETTASSRESPTDTVRERVGAGRP